MNSTFGKKITAVALAFLLALVPLDFNLIDNGNSVNLCRYGVEIQRNEAHAIVPVVAGAGVTALAAELGISVEALYLGTAAIITAGTGYLVTSDSFNNMTSSLSGQWDRLFDPNTSLGDMTDDNNYGGGYEDGSLQPAGTDLWGDLSADEKAKFGTPANYVNETWASLEVETGLLSETGGGGYEPTPTPEGGGPLQTLKNALTVLGVGTGAVLVGDAVNALADTCSSGLKSLLFGAGDDVPEGYGFNVPYDAIATPGGVALHFYIYDVDTIHNNWFYTKNWEDGRYSNQVWFIANTNTVSGTSHKYNVEKLRVYQASGYNYYSLQWYESSHPTYMDAWTWYLSGSNWDKDTYALANGYGTMPLNINVEGKKTICGLNANFAGSYIFDNGYEFKNGSWVGTIPESDVEYGQITGTPNDVTRNILNDEGLAQAMKDYETDGLPNGQKRAITIPSGWGDTAIDPNYETFVQPMPETDITPLPDDQPVNPGDTPTDPDEPGTDPTPDATFGDKVAELLAQPFDELFPFCLVGDLRDLTVKVNSSFNGSADGSVIRLPLSDFGVGGMDALVLDMQHVLTIGGYVKPWFSLLFVVMLLVGTFAYFIKRGGE